MKNVEEKINKKENKIGLKLFLVLFFILYFCLEIGFSGLYTYTTIGVLYTCLMYFSIFVLFACVYMFFKFRKKTEVDEKYINRVLKKCFIDVTVIIILFSVAYIYSYINNMNGILREKENYLNHTNKLQTTIENEIKTEDSSMQSVYENMLEYKESSEKFDKIYSTMKEKMPVYIGLRVLIDVLDIGITAVVLFGISKKMIIKKINKNKDREEKTKEENKIQKEEV